MICHEWGKARLPVSNGLMGERKASLQKHLRQVTQTQLVPQTLEDDKENTIGGYSRKLNRVLVRSLKVRRPSEQQNVR